MQEENTQENPPKSKGNDAEPSTIGKRLRGPSGRKPAPTWKEDYVYTGKENTGKVQSEAKVQSAEVMDSYRLHETASEYLQRQEWTGKLQKIPAFDPTISKKERKENEDIIDWVNISPPYTDIFRIDALSIKQSQLACLTNPYLENEDRYLGDEVIDAFIENYKLTTPVDVREDSSVFVERAINATALENDGRKNAKVHLCIGGSRRGEDYLTNNLIFLPIHMRRQQHWFLVSVNTTAQTIQVLNSITHDTIEDEASREYLRNTLRGMESNIEYAIEARGADICVWKHPRRNFHVTTWPIEVIDVPQQRDGNSCGLFLIKNILNWNGRWLIQEFDQESINHFRPELALTLIKSPHNQEGRPKIDKDGSTEI